MPQNTLKNAQNDTVSFRGLSRESKRKIDLLLAAALLCAAGAAGTAVQGAQSQPKEPVSIGEQAEIQTPDFLETEATDTGSDEEKFKEAKNALIQTISDYEASATQWSLYGSGTALRAINESTGEDKIDYSDFIKNYKNLITFSKEPWPGLEIETYDIKEDIKDTNSALNLIRSTVYSALLSQEGTGGDGFTSLTSSNDLSKSERSGILNLLNCIISSKDADDEVRRIAEIYKEEIIKAEHILGRPSYYKEEVLEQKIENNDALKDYIEENADRIIEAAEGLKNLNEAHRFSNTTDGMSTEYKELDELYHKACESADYKAQREIRAKQSALYEEHYRNTVFPLYQTYFETYAAEIVTPLSGIWPDLKYASTAADFSDMAAAVMNAEMRLQDELQIPSDFYVGKD